MNLFRMRQLSNLLALTIAVAVSSAIMFGAGDIQILSVSALISPRQLPAAVHHRARSSMQTTIPFQNNKNHNHIGVTTTSMMLLKSKTPTTSSGWIGQHHQPRSRSRHSTAIMLGPGNNNNGNSGGGASDMDPGLKLLVCILIDFVGVASFAVPGLGEATDVGWAPISALLVNYLFGNGIFTALAFVEEISPGLDFIPTATLAWFFENANKEEPVVTNAPAPPSSSPSPSSSQSPRRKNSKPNESDVIDVEIVD